MTVLRERERSDRRDPRVIGRTLRRLLLRHPVLSVVLLAFGVRAVLAVLISVVSGGSLFQDDSTYPVLAAQHAFGKTESWDYYEYFLFDATSTLLLPLSWLYQWFGYSVLIGQLLVAAWAAVAAGAVTRLALEGLPRAWALAPGLVVALLPSQVLFSSTVFKDAAVWALLAGLGLAVAVLCRSRGWRAVLLLAAVAVIYLLLAHLRLHTLIAAAWAAGLAVLVAPGGRLLVNRVGMVALTLCIPLALGLGVGGWSLVTDASATLEQRRLGNATGAATAFVPSPPTTADSSSEPEPGAQGETSIGGVTDPVAGRSSHALIRGLSVMLLEPYPTAATFENRRVTFALAENLVWWPLLALAVVGVAQVPRERRLLAFPLLAAGAIIAMYALSEGNFGTAFRHRGEVVWAVGLLAAFGARSLIGRLSRQESGAAPSRRW
jgi:hypothetical protein